MIPTEHKQVSNNQLNTDKVNKQGITCNASNKYTHLTLLRGSLKVCVYRIIVT